MSSMFNVGVSTVKDEIDFKLLILQDKTLTLGYFITRPTMNGAVFAIHGVKYHLLLEP